MAKCHTNAAGAEREQDQRLVEKSFGPLAGLKVVSPSSPLPPVPTPVPGAVCLRAVIHEAEEGGYWAEVPGFPGCVSEGDTLEEVKANIREAFLGVLAVMQEEPPAEAGFLVEISL